jgi:4-aminobutyrate aminotransferase-like enzyme
LDDERLPERAAAVGERLRRAIRALGSETIVEVRGAGLLAGVQLRDPELARRAADELRERGVLVGRTGLRDDVLKIRPPLVFAEEHADLLTASLAQILVYKS